MDQFDDIIQPWVHQKLVKQLEAQHYQFKDHRRYTGFVKLVDMLVAIHKLEELIHSLVVHKLADHMLAAHMLADHMLAVRILADHKLAIHILVDRKQASHTQEPEHYWVPHKLELEHH